MNASARCQKCGVGSTGQAIGNLCASCLLELALEPPPEVSADLLEPSVPCGIPPKRIRYFGDYELVQEIARGGMGVVYKARQVSLNRQVALKMILAGDFSSPAMVERFRTEAEAAARLEHPNIVPIYEIGEQDGQHYFSMRFVEGGTLTHALAKGKPSAREAAELMVKVARALHHAHQRGIIHRDLKPGNILLDETGNPHVTDFGLAKLLELERSLTQSATVLGTPAYMAPEQAQGQMKKATTAVDVYSLGSILYELLTGRPPFLGRSALELLVQVRDREPPSPQSLVPSLSRDLTVICLKCLEKDPERRYGSAEALAEDLQRWLNHQPILARQTTAFERVGKWARRKPVVAGLLAVLHLVLLGGIAGIVRYSNRATAEAERANREAENARVEASRADAESWTANFNEARAWRIAGGPGARIRSSALVQKLVQRPGLTERQTLDLREEVIAQLALVDIRNAEHRVSKPSSRPLVWGRHLDRYIRDGGSNLVELCEYPSERVLASFVGPPRAKFDQAVLSADNQFLVVRFSEAGGEVRVWNLATQEMMLRTDCERFSDGALIAISPDSRTLAMLTPQGVVVQALARESPKLILQRGRPATRAAFSPDSRRLAVIPADNPESVEIWDASSGGLQCSFSVVFSPHQVAWQPDGSRLLVGGSKGRLELWAVGGQLPGAECATGPVPLNGHLGYIDQMFFAPDGSTAFTHAWDSSSIIWDLVSVRPLLRIRDSKVLGINATSERIVNGVERPASESVVGFLGRTGYRSAAWAGEARESNGVWTSPDGRLGVVNVESVVSQAEGDCLIWDFVRGTEIGRVKGVWATFSADSQTLFVFQRYHENRVMRYDVSVRTLANLPPDWSRGKVVYQGSALERVNTGTLSPDGRTLVIAATDAVIFLDTRGDQPTRIWRKPAYYVGLSQDGRWVATMKHHEPSTIRDARDGRSVLRLDKYSLVRFSLDNRWMAVTTKDAVRIFELESLETGAPRLAYGPIALEVGSSSFAPPLEFSQDNRLFAIPYNRLQVRLYETATGRQLATLSPTNPAQIIGNKSLEFSADGQWLLASKEDGETVTWNLPVVRSELDKLKLNWEDRP